MEAHLFFAVSTAFTATAPLVPGSLTYSNLGAGAWGGGGKLMNLSDPGPVDRGCGGRSSDRRPSAFVSSRGRKRECDEAEVGCGSGGGGGSGIG